MNSRQTYSKRVARRSPNSSQLVTNCSPNSPINCQILPVRQLQNLFATKWLIVANSWRTVGCERRIFRHNLVNISEQQQLFAIWRQDVKVTDRGKSEYLQAIGWQRSAKSENIWRKRRTFGDRENVWGDLESVCRRFGEFHKKWHSPMSPNRHQPNATPPLIHLSSRTRRHTVNAISFQVKLR